MVLVEKLSHFAKETTVHGIGYIAKSTSSLKKRMLWLFLLTAALTYAGLQIKSVVECKFLSLFSQKRVFSSFFLTFQHGVRTQLSQ